MSVLHQVSNLILMYFFVHFCLQKFQRSFDFFDQISFMIFLNKFRIFLLLFFVISIAMRHIGVFTRLYNAQNIFDRALKVQLHFQWFLESNKLTASFLKWNFFSKISHSASNEKFDTKTGVNETRGSLTGRSIWLFVSWLKWKWKVKPLRNLLLQMKWRQG